MRACVCASVHAAYGRAGVRASGRTSVRAYGHAGVRPSGRIKFNLHHIIQRGSNNVQSPFMA